MHDEIQVIARSTEDGVTDEIFFENFGEGTPSAVPSALTRWAEEGQILDAQGIHYCVAAVKPGIIPVLLKYQAEEIAKGREVEQKKKADAQAKAAATKKEEQEKKKQESNKDGGETSTPAEGEGTFTDIGTAVADAAASMEVQGEGMQVEQQPAAASEPAASEQGASGDASVLVSMSMDEPILETSAASTDQATVRTSTPADDVPAPTVTSPTPAGSVVQDIISAATVEAASLRAGDEVPAPPPVADNPQGTASEAESTDQDARQQEDDSSPMALGEEGTVATTDAESAQDSFAAALIGAYVFEFQTLFLTRKYTKR